MTTRQSRLTNHIFFWWNIRWGITSIRRAHIATKNREKVIMLIQKIISLTVDSFVLDILDKQSFDFHDTPNENMIDKLQISFE